MTKKIFAIIVAVMLCLSVAVSASADTMTYVYDPDYNLTDSEIAELHGYAESVEEDYGYSVIFCIVSDCGEMTCAEYAADAYISFTDAEDAIVFVHNTDEGVYDYYLEGDAAALDEALIDIMWNAYYSNDSYFGGLSSFYATAAEVIENMPPVVDTQTGDSETDNAETVTEKADETAENKDDGKKGTVSPIWIPICLLIGLLIGFVIINSIASKNISVKMQKNATVYTREGSMVLTGSADNFLYSEVDRREKPKSDEK